MNYLKRSLTNIQRNFKKSVLFLLSIFVLGCIASGAISTWLAVQNVDASLRRNLPPVLTIDFDSEAAERNFGPNYERKNIESLSMEVFSEIGLLPYVKNYSTLVNVPLLAAELKRYDGHGRLGNWEYFTLTGVNSLEFGSAEEVLIEVSSGRTFSSTEIDTMSYVAIVSEEFADLNNLYIGSTFELDNIIFDTRNTDGSGLVLFTENNVYTQRSYTFEVIGLFESLAEFDTGIEGLDASMMDEQRSRIYTPFPVAIAAHTYQMEYAAYLDPGNELLQGDHGKLLWIQNAYVLNDPAEIEDFRVAAEMLLPEFWEVSDLSNAFGGIAAGMESIGNLALLILWLVAGSSAAILSLIVIFSLRERKREVGLYLALGERKGKIAVQIVTEILAIALVAICLSLFVGNFLAQGISEIMLRNDMVSEQRLSDDSMYVSSGLEAMGFAISDTATEEVLAAYDVSLNLATVATFFAVSIATVLVATILPMLYIVRLNPKKIML